MHIFPPKHAFTRRRILCASIPRPHSALRTQLPFAPIIASFPSTPRSPHPFISSHRLQILLKTLFVFSRFTRVRISQKILWYIFGPQ
jgi:hypothetical protein